jgi:16S rRNA G966 N2-methylase RsmD
VTEGTIEQVLAGEARWTVVTGDCLDVLPTLPPEASRIVCADPPYGFGKYPTDRDVTLKMLALVDGWETLALKGYAQSLYQWLRIAGIESIAEWVTWTPTNHAGKAGGRWRGLPRWSEHFAVCGSVPGAGRLMRERSPSAISNGIQMLHRSNMKHAAGFDPASPARMGDWWNDAAPGVGFHSHQRIHPNETPLGVMLKLVELLSEPGDLILDPFAGASTLGVAALRLGRRVIAVENVAEWAELSRDRMRAEADDSTLEASRAGQCALFSEVGS